MKGQLALSMLIAWSALAAPALAQEPRNANPLDARSKIALDLPAQPLAKALHEIGDQLDINILFDPADISGVPAPAIRGSMTLEEALSRLLANTALQFHVTDTRTVTVTTNRKAIARQ